MPRQGAAAGRYRMSDQGQPTQRGLTGMYVLKENSGCQVYRPTWNGTRTVFRIFPQRDPEDHTKWDPYRLSDEDRDWGDWIRRYDMAFGLGTPGINFITKDPFDQHVDDQQNPVHMLHRAILQAVKSGTGDPSWNPLIFGAAGRSAPLTLPKDGYLVQGILMEHKSQPQNPPRGCALDHQPVVLLMSQSAGSALLDKLSEKNPETGEWLWPDITNLDGGLFVQFHQAGTQRSHSQNAPRQMTQQVGGNSVAENNRYEVELYSDYNGISPTYEGIHQVAEAHVRPWDDIVRIPSIETQVKMICNAGIPASAITYALGEVYRDYIPQHVWDQANAQSGARQKYVAPAQTGGGQGNPMQTTAASPMGGASQATQPDPAMQGGMQTGTPAQAVSQTSAQPAGEKASQVTPVGTKQVDNPTYPPQEQPTASPEAEGFDPQPTNVDPQRASATMDAIARARARANQSA